MQYKDLENKELVVWISFYLFYLLVCFRIILCISYMHHILCICHV